MTQFAVHNHISARMLIKHWTKLYTSTRGAIYEMLINVISHRAFAYNCLEQICNWICNGKSHQAFLRIARWNLSVKTGNDKLWLFSQFDSLPCNKNVNDYHFIHLPALLLQYFTITSSSITFISTRREESQQQKSKLLFSRWFLTGWCGP